VNTSILNRMAGDGRIGPKAQKRGRAPRPKPTPDTTQEARIREANLEALRREKGTRWVEEHQAYLDAEWEFAKQAGPL
jgi:hypothetical protein